MNYRIRVKLQALIDAKKTNIHTVSKLTGISYSILRNYYYDENVKFVGVEHLLKLAKCFAIDKPDELIEWVPLTDEELRHVQAAELSQQLNNKYSQTKEAISMRELRAKRRASNIA